MKNKNNNFNTFLKSEYAILLVLLFFCVVISITTPRFAQMDNILSVIQRTAITGIAAVGMTYVIATGGIDLSVGGILCISALAGGLMLAQGTAIPVVILAMLAVGMGVGAVNGLFVSIFKFPPFMVTLSVMQITRGLVLYFTQGKTIYGFKDESFAFIGQGYLAKIPTAIWIFAVVGILAWVFLKKFTYGRKVLAVGSNATGAWYAGTNVKRVLFSVYVVSGFTAAVSGIISISRLMSTNSTLGDGLELDAIAAVVIGGTSLSGGSGFVLGTIVGALIIEVISNWLNLQGVDPFIREVIKGIIILLALLIDSARKGELANIRKSNNF